jgi:hypothetical protein
MDDDSGQSSERMNDIVIFIRSGTPSDGLWRSGSLVEEVSLVIVVEIRQ